MGHGARTSPLRIGLSASMIHPDPTRELFKGRRLLYVEESMAHWVMAAGAMAFVLPSTPVAGVTAADLVDSLDALILTGGVDVAPGSYQETPLAPEWGGDAVRDAYDSTLIRAALAADRPLLGICRGHQILNVTLGGSLFQDIATQVPSAGTHRDWEIYDGNEHHVRVDTGVAWLRDLYGVGGRVNSVHHQAIKGLAPELVVAAWSESDDLVEAVQLKGQDAYAVGVQWHPEFIAAAGARATGLLPPRLLLDDFLAAARRRRA